MSEPAVTGTTTDVAGQAAAVPGVVAPSGTVHWVGTGRSTGSGLRLTGERGDRLVVWGRSAAKAEDKLAAVGFAGRATAARFDLPALAAALAPGDVVVSMLPATEHAALLRLCVERQAHFACTSYVSPDLLAASAQARQEGIVVLTETGLDPGIDHLFAHLLIGRARDEVGDGPATAEFTSYCGGVPAALTEFRYRFSWAPLGVLTALCAPARYVEDGAERHAENPWTATRRVAVGTETFEAYPNRDSTPFITQYRVPPAWRLHRFVRGTLRLDGWLAAWEPVFAELRRGDRQRIEALAAELAMRYPTRDGDRDRVVLRVALGVRAASGASWHGECRLDLVGDAAETAMARTVSVPLALAVSDVLGGTVAPGLHRGAPGVERLLAGLRDHGIDYQFTGGEQ